MMGARIASKRKKPNRTRPAIALRLPVSPRAIVPSTPRRLVTIAVSTDAGSVRSRQLTDDGNLEITGRDVRERNFRPFAVQSQFGLLRNPAGIVDHGLGSGRSRQSHGAIDHGHANHTLAGCGAVGQSLGDRGLLKNVGRIGG